MSNDCKSTFGFTLEAQQAATHQSLSVTDTKISSQNIGQKNQSVFTAVSDDSVLLAYDTGSVTKRIKNCQGISFLETSGVNGPVTLRHVPKKWSTQTVTF